MSENKKNGSPKALEEEQKKTGKSAETGTKKFNLFNVIYVVIIVAIIAAFAALIYYNNVIKPYSDFDDELGYRVEDYISVSSYTGFDYEITQDDFDESVYEETDYYVEVSRAIKETDQVDFKYTAYIDGEKDENVSYSTAEIIIGEDNGTAMNTFADAMIGHKDGDVFEIEDVEVQSLASSDVADDYEGVTATVKIKIKSVSKLVREEVTDDWVADNYEDYYGLTNSEEFYEWCEEYIVDNAKQEVWELALEAVTMSSYPQDLYDDVVEEFQADAAYYADLFGLEVDEYLYDLAMYTDDTLEEEYLLEVKSALLMWYIVKHEDIEVTDDEIEEQYYYLYEDLGYDTVDEMQEDYTDEEVEESVYLEKVQDYVYENSNIEISYTIPE